MNRYLTRLWLLFAIISLFVLSLAAPGVGAQASDYKLTVLHTSENHGAWEPWPAVANGPVVGGIARRATLVKQLRGQGGNFILVDSGDISQRSLLFAKFKGQEGRDFYNAVGYDAVALGNHEFDFGPKVLLDSFVTGAKFDILAANTDYSVEPGLTGKVKPYVVKDIGGQRVGVIGVMHAHLATSVSPAWRVFSTDPVEAVRSSVKALEGQGVNKIIVLSHVGYSSRRGGLSFDDIGIAEAVDGVDVIVGGHDETLLADAAKLPSFAPKPAGANPSVVKSPNGNPVLIVNNWKWGAFLGRLDVTFDGNGVAKTWNGDNIVVDDKIAEDTTVAGIYTQFAASVEEIRKEVVGQVARDLPGERVDVRAREAALGNLVADAMLDATTPDKTQIAMMNGGGIRVTLKGGTVTRGDVLTVLPFGNVIVSLDLSGAQVKEALENAVSGLNADNPGASAGKFAQVAGVRFSADVSKPIGQRVLSVEVGSAKDGYRPLDANATYRVATNDFMANGGDGYEVFTRGKKANNTDVLLADAVVSYLRGKGTVDPKVEGRITLGGQASAPPAAQGTPGAGGTPAVQATPRPDQVPTRVATAVAPGSLPTTGASGPAATVWWVTIGAAILLLGLLLLAIRTGRTVV